MRLKAVHFVVLLSGCAASIGLGVPDASPPDVGTGEDTSINVPFDRPVLGEEFPLENVESLGFERGISDSGVACNDTQCLAVWRNLSGLRGVRTDLTGRVIDEVLFELAPSYWTEFGESPSHVDPRVVVKPLREGAWWVLWGATTTSRSPSDTLVRWVVVQASGESSLPSTFEASALSSYRTWGDVHWNESMNQYELDLVDDALEGSVLWQRIWLRLSDDEFAAASQVIETIALPGYMPKTAQLVEVNGSNHLAYLQEADESVQASLMDLTTPAALEGREPYWTHDIAASGFEEIEPTTKWMVAEHRGLVTFVFPRRRSDGGFDLNCSVTSLEEGSLSDPIVMLESLTNDGGVIRSTQNYIPFISNNGNLMIGIGKGFDSPLTALFLGVSLDGECASEPINWDQSRFPRGYSVPSAIAPASGGFVAMHQNLSTGAFFIASPSGEFFTTQSEHQPRSNNRDESDVTAACGTLACLTSWRTNDSEGALISRAARFAPEQTPAGSWELPRHANIPFLPTSSLGTSDSAVLTDPHGRLQVSLSNTTALPSINPEKYPTKDVYLSIQSTKVSDQDIYELRVLTTYLSGGPIRALLSKFDSEGSEIFRVEQVLESESIPTIEHVFLTTLGSEPLLLYVDVHHDLYARRFSSQSRSFESPTLLTNWADAPRAILDYNLRTVGSLDAGRKVIGIASNPTKTTVFWPTTVDLVGNSAVKGLHIGLNGHALGEPFEVSRRHGVIVQLLSAQTENNATLLVVEAPGARWIEGTRATGTLMSLDDTHTSIVDELKVIEWDGLDYSRPIALGVLPSGWHLVAYPQTEADASSKLYGRFAYMPPTDELH